MQKETPSEDVTADEPGADFNADDDMDFSLPSKKKKKKKVKIVEGEDGLNLDDLGKRSNFPMSTLQLEDLLYDSYDFVDASHSNKITVSPF